MESELTFQRLTYKPADSRGKRQNIKQIKLQLQSADGRVSVRYLLKDDPRPDMFFLTLFQAPGAEKCRMIIMLRAQGQISRPLPRSLGAEKKLGFRVHFIRHWLLQTGEWDRCFCFSGLLVAVLVGVILGIALGVILLLSVMVCQRKWVTISSFRTPVSACRML